MIFVVLYKYVNCAVDKATDTGYTSSTDCNTNYRTMLLMFFITPWCKPSKTDPSRDIYTYTTWVKSFFGKYTPW